MTASPRPGFDQLYHAAPCGLLSAGPRGELREVNATLCRWLLYEREELLGGMRFAELLTMGGRIFHQTHLAPLLRMQGSVGEVKLEMRRKDGSHLPVMVNAAERSLEGELVLHVAVFVAEDRHKYEQELLLQRRRAEQLLRQHEEDQQALALARAQAEDRAAFAEQMVGIVSHDLRNPLSAIDMSATLLSLGQLDDRQRAAVERIRRSAAGAERLLADLLDFTQARLGGGLRVQPAQVDLHDVLGECVEELAAAFPERTVRHMRAGPGACDADPHRMAQAVGNLLRNALTYGAPDRPVTLATQGLPEGRFVVSVHNEGEPIPQDRAAALFEPMVRGDGHGAGARGVGLGLYIVRAIATAHGGEASVRSTLEQGTTFAISIPCARPAA